MRIAGCLWSLPHSQVEAARIAAEAGFDSIDVDPGFTRLAGRQENLPVTCVAIAHLMPPGAELDAEDEAAREQALEHAGRGLGEAQALGAGVAYVGPPATPDRQARIRYRSAVVSLANQAQARGLRLGIEHFPGRGLPIVAGTLAFIQETDHPNLYLLLDIGHCQMMGESVEQVIALAGDRLACVHFDDNDGTADQHRALLDGIQQEEDLIAAVRALRQCRYDGAVSIETNPGLEDPVGAFVRSLAVLRRTVERALAGA